MVINVLYMVCNFRRLVGLPTSRSCRAILPGDGGRRGHEFQRALVYDFLCVCGTGA